MLPGKIRFLDKLLFTKHLAIMMKAGIPIIDALETIKDQTKSNAFRKILATTSKDIRNGRTLSFALGKEPTVFDSFYTGLISVGEESGTLEESLTFLSEQLSKEYNLVKKIQGALLYPAIILSATTIMGGFISLFILPKLVDFFQAFEVELPLPTKVLLFFALLMKNHGLKIFGSIGAICITFFFITRIPRVKPKWHSLMLKIPFIGSILTLGTLARLTRNFAVLIKSGVPVEKALAVTANISTNLKFKNDLLEINKELLAGKNISATMEKHKYFEFPTMVSKMIEIGERTGKLDEILLYLADFYENEIDYIMKNLTTTLEPIMLLIIGLIVGFVALAIITPIYELTGSIRGN